MKQLVTSCLSADSKLPKGFDRYKQEKEQKVRPLTHKENKVVQQLTDIFRKYRPNKDDLVADGDYPEILALVKDMTYSTKDVELFSIALAEFQDEELFAEKAGLFLSALINGGAETNYIVHTKHLEKELWFLGYQNTKNIRIKGNAGSSAFDTMETGVVIVEGNCGQVFAKSMKGGTIIINGDAQSWCSAEEMEGGIIIIKGDLKGDNDGSAPMDGGEIHVYGDCTNKAIKTMAGNGKFYHKGVLVAGKK